MRKQNSEFKTAFTSEAECDLKIPIILALSNWMSLPVMSLQMELTIRRMP